MSKFVSTSMVMLALICLMVVGCGGGGSSSSGAPTGGNSDTTGGTGGTGGTGDTGGTGGTGGSGTATTFRISGTVTSDGTGLSGATVTLAGPQAATAYTDSNGHYAFDGLPNGTYSICITKANYSCLPKTSSYTINGANISVADFTAAPSSPIFYVVDDTNQLAKLDIAARSVEIIGDTKIFLNDIAFDASGNLYGISGEDLFRIDPTTANTTLVGPISLSEITSLEFGPNGSLYTANASLSTVDPLTGGATVIGGGGDIHYKSSGDLAFLGNQMYLTSILDQTSNALVRLDPATGVGTLVGPVGFTNVFGLSTNDNVTLYGFTGSKVITIDTTTGAAELLWEIDSTFGLHNINGATAR